MTQWIITSSVLIVIIAVLRFVLRGKISLKLQYALWGLVLIRLLLPFSVFESPASVLNLLQKREETVAPPAIYEPYEPETVIPITPAVPDEEIFILDDNIEHIEPETNITVDDEGLVTEPEIRVISAKDILIPIWIGGIEVFGAVFAVSNIRFSRKLKNTREYLNETKAWLPVYKSSAVKTPCLFGAIKPAIYVTEEVLKDEKTICHVLEHETTHYRHGDHIWSVLRCFGLALHWYNPLVWLAAFLSMRDAELACDEDTIKRIGEDERIGYGRTLINLTCEKPAVGILSAATTMTGSKSSIKERVLLIAKRPKMLWITAIIVAVVAIFAVGCTFTGAIKYNPKTTDELATETFSNKIEPELSGLDGTIRMTVTAASPKEITTEIFNKTSEDICYRISYSIYFEKDGKWYVLPKINEDNEFDFGEKIIKSGKSGLWESDIKEIYGKLPDGKYCINRTINFGDMEFAENEFYVIGAEFILKDGKLVSEAPSAIEKGEYTPAEQIFINFASSFSGIPEEKYQITDNAFVILDSETGNEINSFAVSDWKWEEFPYSEEEWKTLFIATDELPFPDISSYRSRYYQPIDDEKFIASMDGELWLVDLSHKKPGSEELWVWSIYEISQTETLENNKAYWECAPAMSSKLPWFEFEFDFDFSLINVGVYTTEGQGSLYDIHTGEDYNTLALKNGDFIRWAPYVGDSGLNFAQSATVNFVVYQNGDVYNYTHTGSLKIKQLASENGKTLYEATLISESLGLFQNEETGGGIIYIKPPEKVNAEYSEEEYKSAVKELGYTEDRLSYFEGLFDEGLSPLAVMDPIKYCKAFGETTWPYGLAYSLGSFYFDPEIYVDHGGPIGCVYIRNNLKDRKVEIVPEYVHNFARWGVLDSRDFYFGDFDGIRIYNIDDISKPSSVWNVPEEKLLNKNWKPIITSASSKGNGEVVVIWVNRPEDFDAPLRGNNLDKTNYMISVVDTEGNTVGDYDTGIKIKLTNGGMNDVVHPEIVATTKNKVLFKVKNVHYVFDYGKENPIAEQYIFTENDVVRYSNIDFDGEFAASAINEVIKLIENGYSENSEIESFNIRRAEIDEDATNREINLIGSGVKERYSPDDCMNRFLVVRTVTDENFKDGSSRERVIKYFLLYDPTNKYEHGQMLGNGWKRVDISKESFEIPEFDDDRFYSDFEKEGNKEPEYDEEYWINLVKNLEVKKVYKTEKAFPQVVGEIGYLMLEEEKIEVIKLQSVGVSGDENEFYANYLFITKDGMEFNLQVRMRKTDEGYGFLGGGFGGGYVKPLSYGLEKADIELIDILYSKE